MLNIHKDAQNVVMKIIIIQRILKSKCMSADHNEYHENISYLTL